VHLGQLTADRRPHGGRLSRKRGEAPGEPLTGLEGDHESPTASPTRERAFELHATTRQVADEAEAVALEAGRHEGRDDRRWTGQHRHRDPLLDGARDQTHARVLDAGRAGVGDEGDLPTLAQQGEHLLRLLRLVVLEEAREGRVHAKVAEEFARVPRVFGGDEVDRGQPLGDAERHVAEVADRRGTDVQHQRPLSMKTTS